MSVKVNGKLAHGLLVLARVASGVSCTDEEIEAAKRDASQLLVNCGLYNQAFEVAREMFISADADKHTLSLARHIRLKGGLTKPMLARNILSSLDSVAASAVREGDKELQKKVAKEWGLCSENVLSLGRVDIAAESADYILHSPHDRGQAMRDMAEKVKAKVRRAALTRR